MLTPAFNPAQLKGMVINPADPFKFDFIVNRGDEPLTAAQKQDEYSKLIKYFLAALAVPDTDQWVNLSPYEKDRIIPDGFGRTEMGRDLLAQDYLLKHISASLTNPDTDLGKKFWSGVYEQAYQKFGTTDIPTDTFNKIWITPDKAVVYEKGHTVYVLEHHLKVMMESDYKAMKHIFGGAPAVADNEVVKISKQVMREVIIPAIEKEVNEGRNFAPLRQVYSGMLLASWYKLRLKDSILGKLYADRSKVKGVDQDPKNNQVIYSQYVQAFKTGVFNLIKEEVDRHSQEVIPRKYFSGGAVNAYLNADGTARVLKCQKGDNKPDPIAEKFIVDEAQQSDDAATVEVRNPLSGTLNKLGTPKAANIDRAKMMVSPKNAVDLAEKSIDQSPMGQQLKPLMISSLRKNLAMLMAEFDAMTKRLSGLEADELTAYYETYKLIARASSMLGYLGDTAPVEYAVPELLETVFRSIDPEIRYDPSDLDFFGGDRDAMETSVLTPLEVELRQAEQERNRALEDANLWAQSRWKDGRALTLDALLAIDPARAGKVAAAWAKALIQAKDDDPIITPIYAALYQSHRWKSLEEVIKYELNKGLSYNAAKYCEKLSRDELAGDFRERLIGHLKKSLEANQREMMWHSFSLTAGVLMVKAIALLGDRQYAVEKLKSGAENSALLNRIRIPMIEALVALGETEFVKPLLPSLIAGEKDALDTGRESRDYKNLLKILREINDLAVNSLHDEFVAKALSQLEYQSAPLFLSLHHPLEVLEARSRPEDRERLLRDFMWRTGVLGQDLFEDPYARNNLMTLIYLEDGGLLDFLKSSMKAPEIAPVTFEEKLRDVERRDAVVSTVLLVYLKKDEEKAMQVNYPFTGQQFDYAAKTPGQDVLRGGIDFAQSNLDMQIKRDGAGVPLPISQQNLDNIRIDGLVPVILNIRPAVGAPVLSYLVNAGLTAA
ncbi:MAG: hypothetical protein HQL20_08785 [Candidatus Omnitrophica bacterium]|nr:hypothetical protein [Candidatus Omnitrophota bacterium]